MKDKLINEILKLHPSFPMDKLEKGIEKFELKTFKAKTIIAEHGKVTNTLFFADQSISRCFYLDHDGTEQTFFTAFKSFTNQTPSEFGLQFYEDTQAYCISRKALLELYSSSKE